MSDKKGAGLVLKVGGFQRNLGSPEAFITILRTLPNQFCCDLQHGERGLGPACFGVWL